MTLFGYEVYYNRLSYKQQLSLEESTYAMPSFGFGYWTFNNRIIAPYDRNAGLRQKRPVIGLEKGLYIHIWLFSNRFDIDFRKRILNESQD